MLQETDQRQAYQELCGTATGAFSESGGDLFERVGALTPAACRHQLLKGGTISRDGRIEPGIICGAHIDHGAHLGVRLAQDLSGTFFPMHLPLSLAGPVGRPFHGTVIVDAPPTRPKAMPAHGEASRAERDAMVVDLGRGTGGLGVLAPARIEGNDGCDGFRVEKLIDPMRIEATIVHGSPDGNGQGVGRTGLEEAVETRRPHGEVRDMARCEHEMHRQGMLRGHHAVLKVAMAKKVGVPIRVVAPGRCHVRVEALVLAPKDALRATVTGGLAVWTGPCGQRGAITTQHEGLEVTEEAALDGGEDPAAEEEVFKAGEQLLGPGLVSGREEFLGQPLGDCVRLGGLAGLGGMPLSLFLLEMTPMTPLTQAAGADVVGTRRRLGTVFEAVKKGVEGTDRGRLEGGKARDLRQAWMGAQVMGPLRETFIVQEEHQEEGPEHTDRITGRSPAWARGIEHAEQRPGGVQIEPQEDECGLVPRLR